MGKNTDMVQNILKKKKQLIGVIIIAVIVIIAIIVIDVIMNGKKAISAEAESGVDIESTTNTKPVEDKTACGIKIRFKYVDKYWEKYDLTNAVYKTQEEYEVAVCNYIDEIAKLLDKQDWFKQDKDKDTLYLELLIVNKEAYDDTMPLSSSSRLGVYTPKAYIYTLTLNSAMFEHDIVPIVYQLTDLIVYSQIGNTQKPPFSRYFRNGLNQYVQNFLGMGNASCNHGLDIHNYVIEHEKILENDPTINASAKLKGLFAIGVGATIGSLGTSSVTSANFTVECTSSFVDYLVQTYGIENVMKMADGYDNSIYYLYNQNGLDGLVSDWQQFLKSYPSKMTWDEMDAYITEFKSTHGY